MSGAEGRRDGVIFVYVWEMQEVTSFSPHCYWCDTDGPEFLNENTLEHPCSLLLSTQRTLCI